MTAEGLADKERALAEVEFAKRAVVEAGLEVIRRHAASGRPFSANHVRDELRAVGVEGAKLPGAVWNAARTAGLIRRIGWEPSTDPGTHHKPVARYIAADRPTPLEALVVPVSRTPSGRFTTPTPVGDPPLFEIEGASR